MLASKTPVEASTVCLSCRVAARAFSTSHTRRQFGPEHPRYIEVPEPPQQAVAPKTVIKGTLPVPRPLFTGKRGVPAHRQRAIELSTQKRQSAPAFEADSFLEWRSKVSSQRKQNLADGVQELRIRYDRAIARRAERSEEKLRANREAAYQEEREDDRLTATSNNFNLQNLMRGEVFAEERSKALAKAERSYQVRQKAKAQIRQDHLHTLYTKARSFIVTPTQLEEAIEEAFGTDEDPVLFGRRDRHNGGSDLYSIWNTGKSMTVEGMLKQMDGKKVDRGFAKDDSASPAEKRMRRVAEAMTGGALGE